MCLTLISAIGEVLKVVKMCVSGKLIKSFLREINSESERKAREKDFHGMWRSSSWYEKNRNLVFTWRKETHTLDTLSLDILNARISLSISACWLFSYHAKSIFKSHKLEMWRNFSPPANNCQTEIFLINILINNIVVELALSQSYMPTLSHSTKSRKHSVKSTRTKERKKKAHNKIHKSWAYKFRNWDEPNIFFLFPFNGWMNALSRLGARGRRSSSKLLESEESFGRSVRNHENHKPRKKEKRENFRMAHEEARILNRKLTFYCQGNRKTM